MPLLGAKAYDPAVAVTKSTAAALAMTALDTVNLRVAFNAPASGIVICRVSGVIHGAATFPQVLLGIMEGAVVMGRAAPSAELGGTALATTFLQVEALIPVTGLVSGSAHTFDAAYGVETLVAATGIKYGGPNNAVANDAFGAFIFEVWSP